VGTISLTDMRQKLDGEAMMSFNLLCGYEPELIHAD
jgi:hypothetical protein